MHYHQAHKIKIDSNSQTMSDDLDSLLHSHQSSLYTSLYILYPGTSCGGYGYCTVLLRARLFNSKICKYITVHKYDII